MRRYVTHNANQATGAVGLQLAQRQLDWKGCAIASLAEYLLNLVERLDVARRKVSLYKGVVQ